MQSFAMIRRASLRAVVVVCLISGCASEVVSNSAEPTSMLGNGAQFSLTSLPSEGSIETGSATGYVWPVYHDSINAHWLDPRGLSPAQKYGQAFGISGIEDLVSRYHGVDSFQAAEACSSDAECKQDGSERCGIRPGLSTGRCVPTADGSQAAWASATLLWPASQGVVNHNDTTFTPQDIQALLGLAHQGVVQARAEDGCSIQGGSARLTYQEDEAALQSECLGMGPAQLHLLLGNLIGIEQRKFVEESLVDGSPAQRIVEGYRVQSLDELSGKEANELLGIHEGGLEDTQSGWVGQGQWNHLGPYPINPRDEIRVKLQGDGDVDLYVRFDRAPTEQAYTCRPYLEGTDEQCDILAPEGATQLFISMAGIADVASSYVVEVRVGARVPERYQPNPEAAALFRVSTEIDYLSPRGLDQLSLNAAAQKTSELTEYILELDQLGRVVGGEWLSSNDEQLPTMFWLPLRRSTTSLAGGAIVFSDIESLLRQSLGQSGGRELTLSEASVVDEDQWHHYGPYDALLGEFSARLSGQGGDADLFVRQGSKPTSEEFDCSPYQADSNELCRLRGPGQFYVAVYGALSSTYELEINYVGPGIN